MRHANIQDHRICGSEGEDILFFTKINGCHLGHVTWNIYINFRSPLLRRLHINRFDWLSSFIGEVICGGKDDNNEGLQRMGML